MKWILWVLLSLSQFANASAVTLEQREFYSSARSLAMGNANVAVANDETALLINPAGLGRLRDFYGTILDPEIELNSNGMDMYRTKAFTSPWDLENVAPSLVQSPDKNYHFRGQLFPSLVTKNFGIGIIAKRNLDAVYNSTTAKIDVNYQDDMALVLGYNLRLFEGRIKIGAAAKVINRIELIKSDLDPNGALDMSTLATQGFATSGTGLSTDVGIMLAAPWDYIPTLGAVIHDLGGTSFEMTGASRMDTVGKPTVVAQDADVGLAIHPIHTNKIRSSWTVEHKHVLTAATQTDKMKLYHFGVEFNFSDIFYLRAGYNQRYYTAGLELASEKFQLQFTTYGEEVGDETSPVEDRRYAAKFTFRF
ncbi:MAG: hypothetical protein V4736_14075 [Bdellovibrionota bacterium]